MGPEGPGGQQGSPGTQGRAIQGPVVGVAYPCPAPPVPTPFPVALAPQSVSPPGSTRGQRREGGPWTPRLAGRGPAAPGAGIRPPLGRTWASAWPAASVLFQGHPGLQGTPGKAGIQGPKVGEEPAQEGLQTEAGGFLLCPAREPHPILPGPSPAKAEGAPVHTARGRCGHCLGRGAQASPPSQVWVWGHRGRGGRGSCPGPAPLPLPSGNERPGGDCWPAWTPWPSGRHHLLQEAHPAHPAHTLQGPSLRGLQGSGTRQQPPRPSPTGGALVETPCLCTPTAHAGGACEGWMVHLDLGRGLGPLVSLQVPPLEGQGHRPSLLGVGVPDQQPRPRQGLLGVSLAGAREAELPLLPEASPQGLSRGYPDNGTRVGEVLAPNQRQWAGVGGTALGPGEDAEPAGSWGHATGAGPGQGDPD